MLGTVQRLEGLVAELQAAKLKRAKTMVEAPLQRRVTEGGPSQKMGGSARGLYQRALVRRATAVEGEDEEDSLQRQTTDLSSTIEAALEEAEEVVVPVRTAIVRRLTAIEDSMKEEEDIEVVPTPLKRHSTLNRRTITSIVNSEEDAAAPELMEAAREIEVEAAPEVAVVVEAAPAPEAVVEAAAPVVEEEGPVAALVRRVTEQIQEAVEAKTEASPASATEPEAPVRRKTQLSFNFPGYAPYGYGYPPHPYQYAPPQPYAAPPQQGQMPPPPPYPYYYAPPPPPHGYWAPPHAPMTVPQGAYYPGASVPTASSASVSSSASQTE